MGPTLPLAQNGVPGVCVLKSVGVIVEPVPVPTPAQTYPAQGPLTYRAPSAPPAPLPPVLDPPVATPPVALPPVAVPPVITWVPPLPGRPPVEGVAPVDEEPPLEGAPPPPRLTHTRDRHSRPALHESFG